MGSRIQRTYSEAEVERGLIALAEESGNSRAANRKLKAAGISIPHRTLTDWRRKHHVDRYERIRAEVIPKIHSDVAEEWTELARQSVKTSHALAERAEKEVPNLKPAEVTRAAKDSAITAGIASEKALLFRGQPTAITEQRDISEILKQMRDEGFGVPEKYAPIIEATAEEIPAEDSP